MSKFLSSRKGPLYIVAASLCWSFGGLCIKLIPWDAMSIIGIRSLLGAIVLAIFSRSIKIGFTKGNILAGICLSSTMILFVFANKLTTAAAAILLQFTAPIFIILIMFLLYRQKPKLSEGIAVCITVLGMLLFFADRLEAGRVLGNLLAIASGISFAGVFVFNKRPDTDPKQAILLGLFISTVAGMPFTFSGVTFDPVAWVSIIFLGVVQVGLAYVFFSSGIKRTPALLACLITAMEPVLNPIWVALVTDEVPGVFTLTGGIVIIITIVVYNIWMEK